MKVQVVRSRVQWNRAINQTKPKPNQTKLELITIGFRPFYPEPETNLILESKPESKPELYFFQEPNQSQNRNYFSFKKKNQNSEGFSIKVKNHTTPNFSHK
jgi:hypothetical protein